VELLSAIRAVHQGGTYLHAAHTRVLFEGEPVRQRSGLTEEPEPLLSPREEEVLRLIALGYTSRQAAEKLHLSSKTVDTYRGRLMTKLNLQNRAELVRYALEHGMLDEE
jgi:two-component system response regulator NreC